MLFVNYINDWPNKISKCKINIYEDDEQVLIRCKPTENFNYVNNLNTELSEVYSWAEANPKKSKCLAI